MYGLGLSYNDIKSNLSELYGIDVSKSLLTSITDKIIPSITEWQCRTLDSVYPIVYLDAIFFSVKEDNKVSKKAVYVVLAINKHGIKDILGLYFCQTESSSFWLNVLNDLSNRGVKDILIACIDNLSGFSDAVNAAFPDTEVQLCVIHQIRNSLKYVGSKHQRAFMKDLKEVYKATTKEIAEQNLDLLEEKWGEEYPIVIRSWRKNWEKLSIYFKYPPELRKIIYTTNIVEGFNRQIRKLTKTKGVFPSEMALKKLLYLGTKNIMKKWTMPVTNWAKTISCLAIIFEGRIDLDLDI